MIWGDDDEGPVRRAFPLSVKKVEWAIASGRRVYNSKGEITFAKTSKCMVCGTTLKWGDGRYNFDHKNNDSHNNGQKNCYLVCRNCHGKRTVIKKRAVYDSWDYFDGYKTIKMKVGYKNPGKPANSAKTGTKKKVSSTQRR